MLDTTLECMSCGLPVVATPEGAGGYIEDGVTSYLVDFRSPAMLAERVNFLFDNPDIAFKCGNQNRKNVEENYTLEIIAKKFLEIYKRLI